MDSVNHEFSEKPALGFVDRLNPAWLRPYARLMRADRPIGTWLLLLPCWWGLALAGGFHPVWMLLFAVGAFVMRGAGCVINDMWDRKIDARVARTVLRPLASGEVVLVRALLFLGVLLLIGLGVLLCFDAPVVRLGLGAMPIVVLYPLAKRVMGAPQFVLGLAFNWGALLGWVAVRGTLDWPCVALYAGGVVWTLAYDTIYAHQDKDDDLIVGVKSLAITLGRFAERGIAVFFALALALVALAGAEVGMKLPFYLGLVCAGAHALWQMKGWKPAERENCLARFRSNRDFGLIVLAALMLGRL